MANIYRTHRKTSSRLDFFAVIELSKIIEKDNICQYSIHLFNVNRKEYSLNVLKYDEQALKLFEESKDNVFKDVINQAEKFIEYFGRENRIDTKFLILEKVDTSTFINFIVALQSSIVEEFLNNSTTNEICDMIERVKKYKQKMFPSDMNGNRGGNNTK